MSKTVQVCSRVMKENVWLRPVIPIADFSIFLPLVSYQGSVKSCAVGWVRTRGWWQRREDRVDRVCSTGVPYQDRVMNKIP